MADVTFKTNNIILDAKDLSKYGKEFQMKLLALLIKDRAFAFSIIPIIKDIYFSDIYLRTIYSAIEKYILEFNSCPTLDNVKIKLVSTGEKMLVFDKLLTQIDTISLEDRDFVVKFTRDFCFTKHALVENEKVNLALKEGNFDTAKKLSIEAFQYSGLDSARVFDLKKDYRKIYDNDKFRAPVPSIFKTFTDNSKGGIGAGDLCIVVAFSNFGKSNFLAALARDANVNKKNVLYFTYEETAESITEKYLAGLIDVNRSDLRYSKNEADEWIKGDALANLKIIEDKGSKATISNMKSQIQYVKALGFFPELICVDALTQLKLPKGVRAKDDNEKYEILTEELKELLKEEGIPGYAAWQTSRSGASAELNGVDTIGRAIEVFQKADQVITFSEPAHLKVKQECIAYLLKNRLGRKEIALLVHYDPGKVLFIEKEVINPLVFMSEESKKVINKTVASVRERLKVGEYDKKSNS